MRHHKLVDEDVEVVRAVSRVVIQPAVSLGGVEHLVRHVSERLEQLWQRLGLLTHRDLGTAGNTRSGRACPLHGVNHLGCSWPRRSAEAPRCRVRLDDGRRGHATVAPVRRHGLRPSRRARDRARRGRLGLGQRRSPVPRCNREPVVRERRARSARDRRRGRRTDGSPRGVLGIRRLRQRAGARAR